MAILHSKKYLFIMVKTNNSEMLVDELFGLSWHKVNDSMNMGKDPDLFSYLIDLIKSVSPKDEIIVRYLSYKKLWLAKNSKIPVVKRNIQGTKENTITENKAYECHLNTI
ncbi:MAG: hypothetical protein HQ521_05960 [Bacteroidetes bacterium]|nr:hypothetical protein [Bacteroidota bacterium]